MSTNPLPKASRPVVEVCIGCGKLNPGPAPCAGCCGTVRPAEVIDGRVYYTDGGCNEFGNLERMLAPETA